MSTSKNTFLKMITITDSAGIIGEIQQKLLQPKSLPTAIAPAEFEPQFTDISEFIGAHHTGNIITIIHHLNTTHDLIDFSAEPQIIHPELLRKLSLYVLIYHPLSSGRR